MTMRISASSHPRNASFAISAAAKRNKFNLRPWLGCCGSCSLRKNRTFAHRCWASVAGLRKRQGFCSKIAAKVCWSHPAGARGFGAPWPPLFRLFQAPPLACAPTLLARYCSGANCAEAANGGALGATAAAAAGARRSGVFRFRPFGACSSGLSAVRRKPTVSAAKSAAMVAALSDPRASLQFGRARGRFSPRFFLPVGLGLRGYGVTGLRPGASLAPLRSRPRPGPAPPARFLRPGGRMSRPWARAAKNMHSLSPVFDRRYTFFIHPRLFSTNRAPPSPTGTPSCPCAGLPPGI